MILTFAFGPHTRLPPLGPKARAGSLAGGAVLLWATWPALATAAQSVPPFLAFGLAAAVGFALALAVAIGRGEARTFLRTPPRALMVVGIGLLANNALFLHAVPRIGAAEANVLVYLWPIMLVAILGWWRGERLGRVATGGIVLAFCGAALAIGPTFAVGFDLLGIALAVIGGLAFAAMAAVRSFGREPNDVVGPAMGVIAVLSLTIHVLFEPSASVDASRLLVVGAIGVFPIWLANALWDRATRTPHTALISGIAYLTPLAALCVLAIAGLQTITLAAATGAVLVVIGALATSGVIGAGKRG